MNKINIMPQVTVYRDVLSEKDIQLLLKEIYESQDQIIDAHKTTPEESAYLDHHGLQPQKRNDNTLIYTWTPWYTFGIRSVWSDPHDVRKSKKEHVDGFMLIKNAIKKVHDDYLNDWKDNGKWTYKINDWDIDAEEKPDASNMILSTFELLQHKLNLEEDYNIQVHTDWHNHRSEEPGPKQIITYTIYLNDDYEGGEVDFVDEENKKVFVYKPKRGDITVFPSGRPFWHGARSVKSDPNKIFIRTFSIFRYPGSQEWVYGASSHGIAKWMDMENEKIKAIIDGGEVGRQLVYKGEEMNLSKVVLPIYVDSEVYIDGRNI